MPEQAHVAPDLLAKLRDTIAEILSAEWERLIAKIVSSLQKDVDGSVDDAFDDDADDLGKSYQDKDVIDTLRAAFLHNVGHVETQLGIVWFLKNRYAVDYAHRRAAEMVGMRRTRLGGLVQNPDAKWRIDDTTRDGLKKLVTTTIEEKGVSYRDLKHAIEDMPAFNALFGEYRAEMIARSELAMAANQGTCGTFEAAGIEKVRVLDDAECPICGPFADTIQTLEWARENPIGHPNCVRSFVGIIPGEEE